MPEVSDAESHDWLVAVSHSACVDHTTFSCVGAFKVTICQQPDLEGQGGMKKAGP